MFTGTVEHLQRVL